MSSAPAALNEKPPVDQSNGKPGLYFLAFPVALALFCLAAKFGLISLPHGVRVTLIFVLLVALMLGPADAQWLGWPPKPASPRSYSGQIN